MESRSPSATFWSQATCSGFVRHSPSSNRRDSHCGMTTFHSWTSHSTHCVAPSTASSKMTGRCHGIPMLWREHTTVTIAAAQWSTIPIDACALVLPSC